MSEQIEPKYKVIRVQIEEVYIVEMLDDERSEINGWTLEEVQEEWFRNFPLNQHHASRDTRCAGRKYITSSVCSIDDLKTGAS